VQWTRLPGGETPAGFVERVGGLTSSSTSPASDTQARSVSQPEVTPYTKRTSSHRLRRKRSEPAESES